MPLSLLILIATVQGLTEFLPVSSSGHLVLIPIMTNFAYQGRLIDVAAHVGTLIAVTFYLRIEITKIITALLRFGRSDPVNAGLGVLLALTGKVGTCEAFWMRDSCQRAYSFNSEARASSTCARCSNSRS